LQAPSGFDISESPDWYSTNSSYGEAFGVGIGNTLRIVVVGLVLATVIGVLVGIFLLSSNWLVRNISRTYVEILRNTPLLVQIYFWYFIVMLSLPQFENAAGFPPESINFIYLRYPVYLLILTVIWVLARRTKEPRWVVWGAFAAIGILEVIMRLNLGQVQLDNVLPLSRRDLRLIALFVTGAIILFFFLGAIVSGRINRTFNPSPVARFIGLSVAGVASIIFLALSDNISLEIIVTGLMVVILWFISVFRHDKWGYFALGFIALVVGAVVGAGIFGAILTVLGITPNTNYFIWEFNPIIFFTRRGIAFPEIAFTSRTGAFVAFVGLGIALAIALWRISGHITETTGRPLARGWYAFFSILIFVVVGWLVIYFQPTSEVVGVIRDNEVQLIPYDKGYDENLFTPTEKLLLARDPVVLVIPERGPGSFTRGTIISPNYAGILLGLVIYTSAFIAEIVRAGIQAVPYGQIEAARALGLSYPQTLSRIILPQALRIIIPPLGNQYLNLAKNSSLAVAAAFADTYQIGQTVMNQSGQSVVGFTMIFVVYITMSLVISLVMNIVNSRFQLVTR
jgi:His/Glu/Gln/Arg/opine family amino acid ABC transporter permease subunit